jgi:hypothetical protein
MKIEKYGYVIVLVMLITEVSNLHNFCGTFCFSYSSIINGYKIGNLCVQILINIKNYFL